jgi:hypothetical protein
VDALAGMKLPNFFIVGAPKAGTTSLYAYLDQHPQIYLSPLKEPHFFSAEFRPDNFEVEARPRVATEMKALAAYLAGDLRAKKFGGFVTAWEDYLRLFRNATDEVALGEATPVYLWSPTAARNIAARVPHAKVVMILRDPVERAFSQYLQMLAAGATRRSFRAEIDACLRSTSRKLDAAWSMLEFGLYYEQVTRYLREFPPARVHVALYDDLQRAPQRLLAQVFEFLAVDVGFAPDLSRRHHEPAVPKLATAAYWLKKAGVWPRARAMLPAALRTKMRSLLARPRADLEMRPEDRAFLADYYRDDVAKLAALLGRDLTAWL